MKSKIRTLFDELAEKLLMELACLDGINEERRNYIATLLANVEIRSGDEFPEVMNCYVLVMPEIVDENQLSLKVTLYMRKTEDTDRFLSLLYHEMMHIVSIGQLFQSDEFLCMYKWGICSSGFFVRDGYLYDENFDSMKRLNEALTDLSAEYFFSKFVGRKYGSAHFINPIMRMCKVQEMCTLYELVVPYILNDEDAVNSILARLLSCAKGEELEAILRKNYLAE